ncbi:MAG TPA: imidazole glycerol phosphate synthase subunit HisH [Mycobacteriales bacterium]|jgi:glutamine amidotransferase|nr:imidazole glycerol phosphate synthase subunit HisH [Mycobacteriales bacterium]
MSAEPTVVVLDYGSGNLRSAERALRRAGAEVSVSADRDEAQRADGLVVPGVGAFAACIDGLLASGGDKIVESRIADGTPLLGICVGMQVLFDSGTEHDITAAGLGVLPGDVRRLHAPRLPHMGWNTVQSSTDSALFAGIGPDDRCYFVHSYAACDDLAQLVSSDAVVTYAHHGERFVAGVEAGPVSAVQFHPEKSGDVGAAILCNWVRTL